jgi:hypothetical protein
MMTRIAALRAMLELAVDAGFDNQFVAHDFHVYCVLMDFAENAKQDGIIWSMSPEEAMETIIAWGEYFGEDPAMKSNRARGFGEFPRDVIDTFRDKVWDCLRTNGITRNMTEEETDATEKEG